MFSNDLCIAVWNSYFVSIGKTPPPRDTGIFNDWRSPLDQWELQRLLLECGILGNAAQWRSWCSSEFC